MVTFVRMPPLPKTKIAQKTKPQLQYWQYLYKEGKLELEKNDYKIPSSKGNSKMYMLTTLTHN